MLLPSQTSLRTEDFPSEKEWIARLLTPINRFLLSTISAINGNITFGDNIPCQTQTLTFTYNGASDFPKVFKWNLAVAPVELRVCSATEAGSAIAVGMSWSYANSQVSVGSLFKETSSGNSALTVGTSYTVVVRGNP